MSAEKEMTQSERYYGAMKAGNDLLCARIEKAHDLYGYPPEVVSVGLNAYDAGLDVHAAVDAYTQGAAP